MSESIEVSRVIPARKERIFNAWLSAHEHSQMTGSAATYEPDGTFTAWDGYISGKTLETEGSHRIVQSWRSTEFPEGAEDSKIELVLTDEGDGTRLTVKHTNIPDGQSASYAQGWGEHYFDHMVEYFTSARSRVIEAGEAISEAVEEAGDALQAVGHQAEEFIEEAGEAAEGAVKNVKAAAQSAQKSAKTAARKAQKNAQKTARSVAKSAKKAASSVRGFIKKAKAKLAARGKKKPAARKKAAPKQAAPRKKKVVAQKKKAAAKKKRR